MPYKLRKSEEREIFRKTLIFFLVLGLYFFALGIGLISIYSVFTNRITSMTVTPMMENEDSEKGMEFNRKTNNIFRIQEDYLFYSKSLSDIEQIIKGKGEINSLTLDGVNGNIRLKAVVDNREDIQKLKDTLEEDENISNLSFMINDITLYNYIPITISAETQFPSL